RRQQNPLFFGRHGYHAPDGRCYMRREDLEPVGLLVVEQAVGGFGAPPVEARLVDRSQWSASQESSRLDKPLVEALIPQINTGKLVVNPGRRLNPGTGVQDRLDLRIVSLRFLVGFAQTFPRHTRQVFAEVYPTAFRVSRGADMTLKTAIVAGNRQDRGR